MNITSAKNISLLSDMLPPSFWGFDVSPPFSIYLIIKLPKLIFLYLLILFCFLSITSLTFAENLISLTEDATGYTIENQYYKAIIPTDRSTIFKGRGVVRFLYIKKSNGSWSSNLIMQDTNDYCLGYLEGTGIAYNNRPVGLQGPDNVITVLENTSSRIKIRTTKSLSGTDFSETWTFWAKKPYFRSEASAVVTDANGYLTNQLQFAWMINNNLQPTYWYGTDKDGEITQFTQSTIHQIHSPYLNKYPWINWQFSGEGVSLGMIFVDIYDPMATIGETGDWDFEYQIDFELGSGVLGSPVKKGYRRELTTIYYTSDQVANTNIDMFSQNSYQYASTIESQNPVLQAAQYMTNPYKQNPGIGSAMISSPFFLIRQNTQNRHNSIERPQYETSIYAPLYKNRSTIHTGSYDFSDQLIYSLNYSNKSKTFKYGTIHSANSYNSDYVTSLQMNAVSSDYQLSYSTIFTTWNDSDKLKITGSVSNAGATSSVKDIYLELDPPAWSNSFEAERTMNAQYVTAGLYSTDNLWTNYDYSYDSGTTLIYRDNQETVPSLAVPVDLPDGNYNMIAYVLQRPEGDITYRYSSDNLTWHNFVVPRAASNSITSVNLGPVNIENRVIYIDDDNSLTGIAGWAGWDKINFHSLTVYLGANVYDIRMTDAIYGQMGIGVKINSPADAVSVVNNSIIRVYLYQQPSAETLTTFNYPFDIEIYPHKGWLSNPSDFTALHLQDDLTYTKHIFYVPESVLHTGRVNTIYPGNTVTYSADPYNDSSEINMQVFPTAGSVNILVDLWHTSDTYYKKWTETAANSETLMHLIGDLKPGNSYAIIVNGAIYYPYLSDASGTLAFNYYLESSSSKTFEIVELTPSMAIDNDGDGFTFFDGDCDDNNIAVNSQTEEICDGFDNNCNGMIDEGFPDEDNDGFKACADDCDDSNPIIHPATNWYPDSDKDSYGNPAVSLQTCGQPSGFVLDHSDCNDNDANIHPDSGLVIIKGSPPRYYSSLQLAIDSLLDLDIIEAQQLLFTENVFFDKDITATLNTGFDCKYTYSSGITIIKGNVIIENGLLKLEHGTLKIQ